MAAVVVIAGYASALLSRVACEDRVARDVILWAHQADVYALPDWAVPSSTILARAQVSTRTCDTANLHNCTPLAGVQRGVLSAPFMVAVRWMFSGAPASGLSSSGGRRRFFCFFGIVIELAQTDYETS